MTARASRASPQAQGLLRVAGASPCFARAVLRSARSLAACVLRSLWPPPFLSSSHSRTATMRLRRRCCTYTPARRRTTTSVLLFAVRARSSVGHAEALCKLVAVTGSAAATSRPLPPARHPPRLAAQRHATPFAASMRPIELSHHRARPAPPRPGHAATTRPVSGVTAV